MRIDRLELHNFKKFAELSLDLHPRFTLLVGENGSGKTSILDALAVALGVWLQNPPDPELNGSRRKIEASEIRLVVERTGDRPLLRPATNGVAITATGSVLDVEKLEWKREILPGRKQTSNRGAKQVLQRIGTAFEQSKVDQRILFPVIAYYGAGRAWLPHRERSKSATRTNGPARRWSAFYDCLNDRIRLADLAGWFLTEAIAAANQGGRFRPGYEIVKRAILGCLPEADGMWYDGDLQEIVLSIHGNPQPFSNLSAGQRAMLALTADIAIKMVTQNNFLVPAHVAGPDDAWPEVLMKTPGVVLIDELDVHLHPKWQRRVADDLKQAFPSVQFVCTTHSPQVIGEVPAEQIRLLDEEPHPIPPSASHGLDSNSVLTELQGAAVRNKRVSQFIDRAEDALDRGDLESAAVQLRELRDLQQAETVDTIRIEAAINDLKALADAPD